MHSLIDIEPEVKLGIGPIYFYMQYCAVPYYCVSTMTSTVCWRMALVGRGAICYSPTIPGVHRMSLCLCSLLRILYNNWATNWTMSVFFTTNSIEQALLSHYLNYVLYYEFYRSIEPLVELRPCSLAFALFRPSSTTFSATCQLFSCSFETSSFPSYIGPLWILMTKVQNNNKQK